MKFAIAILVLLGVAFAVQSGLEAEFNAWMKKYNKSYNPK